MTSPNPNHISPPPPQKSVVRKSGWSPERRAKQAAAIRLWAPWDKSTGPKTVSGKAKSALNSFKHGGRGRDMRLMSKALTAQARFLRNLKVYLRLRKFFRTSELLDILAQKLRFEGCAALAMLQYALEKTGFEPPTGQNDNARRLSPKAVEITAPIV